MIKKIDLMKTNDMPASEAAMFYQDNGWEPVPVEKGGKKPRGSWKEPRTYTKEELKAAFRDAGNVAIALGDRSEGLVDIDFDDPVAAKLGRYLFGDLPSFGRASAQDSHRITISSFEKGRYTFTVPEKLQATLELDRAMLLEIRGNGHLTVLPPSVHETGEVRSWSAYVAEVPEVEASSLIERAGETAFLTVVAHAYPSQAGQRDEVCLAITGTLVCHSSLTDEEIDSIVQKIAENAGDEEAPIRGGKAAAARKRLVEGKAVCGLPELLRKLELQDYDVLLRSWLQKESDPRPKIVVRAGQAHEELPAAEKALLKSSLPIFQRGEKLVRVFRLPESEGEDGVRRPKGALLTYEVQYAWLKLKLSEVAIWQRPIKGGFKKIDPPSQHVTGLLAMLGEWGFPVLRGVITSPTLRADGSVLQESGYDPASGLLYDPGGEVFPRIPEHPSKADAEAGLAKLFEPFRKFAFASEADRAVALAALLTGLVRRNLPSAPLFAIDAPTAGSGKSLFAETVGVVTSGNKPTMISQGKSAEEDEKRISSILMKGDSIIVFDNCERPLEGDTLCTMLTQETLAARILGKSEVVRMPTNALVMATGNNLEIRGDLCRRTLVCRIDTGKERPDQLEYGFNPIDEARRNRPALVTSGLTVLRAYLAAGRPVKCKPMGSFTDWDLVRETLIWLGEEDPLVTRERLIADDPKKSDLAELLEVWAAAAPGGKQFTLTQIDEQGQADASDSSLAQLRSALISRSLKDVFNPRSIGRYLGRRKDRVIGVRALRAQDNGAGVRLYWVEDVEPSERPNDAF